MPSDDQDDAPGDTPRRHVADRAAKPYFRRWSQSANAARNRTVMGSALQPPAAVGVQSPPPQWKVLDKLQALQTADSGWARPEFPTLGNMARALSSAAMRTDECMAHARRKI